MGSDCTHRSAQRLATDRADVVVHPDARHAPQDVVGRAVKIRAPLTTRRRQTFRLQFWIVARREGFKPGDHRSTTVLARPVDRYLIGVEHDQHRSQSRWGRTAHLGLMPSAFDRIAVTQRPTCLLLGELDASISRYPIPTLPLVRRDLTIDPRHQIPRPRPLNPSRLTLDPLLDPVSPCDHHRRNKTPYVDTEGLETCLTTPTRPSTTHLVHSRDRLSLPRLLCAAIAPKIRCLERSSFVQKRTLATHKRRLRLVLVGTRRVSRAGADVVLGQLPTPSMGAEESSRVRSLRGHRHRAEITVEVEKVVERVLEVPVVAAIRSDDWANLLGQLCRDLDTGRLYDRALPDVVRALNDVSVSLDRRLRLRR